MGILLHDFFFWRFLGAQFHLCHLIDLVLNIFLCFHFVPRWLLWRFGWKVDILFVLTLAFPFNHRPIVFFHFFVIKDVFDELVQFFFGEEFICVLNDSVCFDVEFGDVEGQFILFTEHALLKTVLNLLFEHSSDWVNKEFSPLNTFFGVDDKHFFENVFNEWMSLSGESQRFVFDFFE